MVFKGGSGLIRFEFVFGEGVNLFGKGFDGLVGAGFVLDVELRDEGFDDTEDAFVAFVEIADLL